MDVGRSGVTVLCDITEFQYIDYQNITNFSFGIQVMAEGVGFEPTVGLTLRSISSRVPSTGLSHPSY